MKRNLLLIILIYSLISAVTIIFFNGTADDGDSIMHFLYARFAPLHLALYFDHWAKPLYVFLASPFAQFGFNGVKIFNASVSLCAIVFTYLSAEKLGFKNSLISALFLIVSPGYYILTFSGLTEPLFALVLILSVYLFINKKLLVSLILLSFLPFVRSEGMILCGVFAIFLVYKKMYRYLPLLLVGHIIYSIAGYLVYHDLLWVFTQNPYSTLQHVYGSGTLFHFADQLQYITGLPLYILFWVGTLACILNLRNFRYDAFFYFIVIGGFFAFFIAHSLFWYLGIFGSMGLNRVLVCVMPFCALIALKGFNLLEGILNRKIRVSVQSLVIACLVIFPFTANHAAINFSKTMKLTEKQKAALKISKKIKAQLNQHSVYCSYPYWIMTSDIDVFKENSLGRIIPENIAMAKSGDFILWDNWYVDMGNNKIRDSILNNPHFQVIRRVKNEQGNDMLIVFRKR